METVITVSPEILPPAVSFKLSCDAIEYCTRHAPRWNPVSFAGYNYREAGCSAPQEIAFVITTAISCSEELIKRGYDIDTFAPRLSFFLSAHSDFFEEIAKYRAARRIWFRIMKERFKAKDPRSLRLRFHVQTAGVALTAQQPLNNISRAAYHALSAALGGAQSVHIDGYDEALCTPTELSSLTALRTNQILQLETRVTHTIDPLGGSYFVESLTNALEAETLQLLRKIDEKGGIVKAVESGWIHKEISDSAYKTQQAMENSPANHASTRIVKLQKEMAEADIDAIFLTYSRSTLYYTGTTQPAICLITPQHHHLFVSRAFDTALEESWFERDRISSGGDITELKAILNRWAIQKGRLGLELDIVPALEYLRVSRTFPEFEVINISKMLLEQRKVKDPNEIEYTKKACEILHHGHLRMMNTLMEGMTQLELSSEIEDALVITSKGVELLTLTPRHLHRI